MTVNYTLTIAISLALIILGTACVAGAGYVLYKTRGLTNAQLRHLLTIILINAGATLTGASWLISTLHK